MENIEKKSNKTYIHILEGLGISILTSLVLLLLFAILLTFTNLSEATINPTIIAVTGVSIVIGSMISSRKIRKNGLVNGAITGVTYIGLLYIFSSVLNENFSINRQTIIMMIIGITFGILGGILGVNLKH